VRATTGFPCDNSFVDDALLCSLCVCFAFVAVAAFMRAFIALIVLRVLLALARAGLRPTALVDGMSTPNRYLLHGRTSIKQS
jgi:hypothetical protein